MRSMDGSKARTQAGAKPKRSSSTGANDAFHIAVIPGDGIGIEVMAPALEILRKLESSHQGLHFRSVQRGRVLQADVADLVAAAFQTPLRVGQLRPLQEAQSHPAGKQHD